jgi:hypothetical protein
MVSERPDLDGLRLIESGGPDVWLIFHGRRHRVPSTAVYDRLFSEIEGLVHSSEIQSIARGDDLSAGACLIRGDGTLAVYLLTTVEGELRRLFVPTYESLRDFRFDEAKVRDVPTLLLQAVPTGAELISAGARG